MRRTPYLQSFYDIPSSVNGDREPSQSVVLASLALSLASAGHPPEEFIDGCEGRRKRTSAMRGSDEIASADLCNVKEYRKIVGIDCRTSR